MNPLNIVLIGAGNVATRLGLELKQVGHKIIQVYSKTIESSTSLAVKLNSTHTNNIDKISSKADIYIIALSDNVIDDFLSKFKYYDKIIVHTSGSVSLDVFCEFPNGGVLYPLQTFSKDRELNFKEIPVLIEGKNEKVTETLELLGNQLSDNVGFCNSDQRKQIHLAAVFVCNFTNHLLHISESIIENVETKMDIFKPLIEETISKAMELSAKNSQTGPAFRNDTDIMNSHLELLSFNSQFQQIYKELSKSILESKE